MACPICDFLSAAAAERRRPARQGGGVRMHGRRNHERQRTPRPGSYGCRLTPSPAPSRSLRRDARQGGAEVLFPLVRFSLPVAASVQRVPLPIRHGKQRPPLSAQLPPLDRRRARWRSRPAEKVARPVHLNRDLEPLIQVVGICIKKPKTNNGRKLPVGADFSLEKYENGT